MSSSKIEIKVNQQQGIPTNSLHILPCRVHHTGTISEVSRYFTPELYKTHRAREVDQQFIKISEEDEEEKVISKGIKGQEDRTKVVYFRGRKLKGVDIDTGNDFVGKFAYRDHDKKNAFRKVTNVFFC
jgi:hypothetical protein